MLSDGAVSWTVELQTKVHIKVPTTALTLKTSWTQFHIYSFLALCLNRILNVKVIVAAFKQEKALVGAFSVIINLWMELFEALKLTQQI